MRAPADRSSATEFWPSAVGSCGASFSDTLHLAQREAAAPSELQPACRLYDSRHFNSLRPKMQAASQRGAKRPTRFLGPMACAPRNVLRTALRQSAVAWARSTGPGWGKKLFF